MVKGLNPQILGTQKIRMSMSYLSDWVDPYDYVNKSTPCYKTH